MSRKTSCTVLRGEGGSNATALPDQILETKQKAFFPVLSGKTVSRTLDDIGTTALTYAEVKAIATGNPKIRRKMELEIEVNRLKILEQQYIGEKHNLQDKSLKVYPQNIFNRGTKINKLDKDIEMRDKNTTEELCNLEKRLR